MKVNVISTFVLATTLITSASMANSLQASSEASQKIANNFATSVSNVTVNALQGTKKMVNKSWTVSGNSIVAVFEESKEFSQNPSQESTDSVQYVITNTGKLIQASVATSGKVIAVVVDESKNVSSAVGQAFVGSVNGSVAAGKYLLDAAGNLWTATGKLVGQVWESTKESAPVTFSANFSGDLKVFSANASDLVVTGSKQSMYMVGGSSATLADVSNKWILTPISKGFQILSNGSQKIWLASEDFLKRLKENSVDTDLTNYSN